MEVKLPLPTSMFLYWLVLQNSCKGAKSNPHSSMVKLLGGILEGYLAHISINGDVLKITFWMMQTLIT